VLKQTIHTRNLFSKEEPVISSETFWKKSLTALLILWLIIILALLSLDIFIDINKKYYTFFIFINFFALGLTAIKIISSFMKKINNIQDQILDISKNSRQLKSVKPPEILKQEIKYETESKKNIDEILQKQIDLDSRVTELESNVYPHLPLNKKLTITEKERLNQSSPAPISLQDLISALNFPKDEKDTKGFQKLRIALSDSESGDLLRASQDVQTLLSQEGIYMDDLNHEASKPEIWRRYSKGERGVEISSMGIDNDHEFIPTILKKLQEDEIFKDATYHFLRHFDSSLQDFCKKASVEEIARFSNTRTARAFIVLGTVTNRFN
tara:strand:+ start:354 stop:1328 length:975 start_codon:yes stop_codon:yes gene_type:complete